ncbi:unnamed protein product, partial [Meganyctiphanes norvegica]
ENDFWVGASNGGTEEVWEWNSGLTLKDIGWAKGLSKKTSSRRGQTIRHCMYWAAEHEAFAHQDCGELHHVLCDTSWELDELKIPSYLGKLIHPQQSQRTSNITDEDIIQEEIREVKGISLYESNAHLETQDKCASGYTLVGSQCLMVNVYLKLTHHMALKHCLKQGGRIATLLDPETALEFLSHEYVDNTFWVGASDSVEEGAWVWSDGNEVVSFPWLRGEIYSGSKDHQCLHFNGEKQGFVASNCDVKMNVFCDAPLKTGNSCPSGFTKVLYQCFHINLDKIMTFEEANRYCEEDMLGRLAILQMPDAVMTFIQNTFTGKNFWFGATYNEATGSWCWGSGSSLGFPWGVGQPDNDHEEDCLLLDIQRGFKDASCGQLHHFVCDAPLEYQTGTPFMGVLQNEPVFQDTFFTLSEDGSKG